MIVYLLNPFLYVVLLICYIWFRWYKSRRKRILIPCFLSLFTFYLFSTPFLITPLVKSLEDEYNPISFADLDSAGFYHIMVLGAGHSYDERLPANSRLNKTTLMRLIEGIRIHRQLSNALLITSANSVYGLEPQANVAQDVAISLGVDSLRIRKLEDPYTTATEATSYVRDFGTETPLILCTSAYHMPRAVALFKKLGVKEVIPAPTDYFIKKDQPVHWGRLLPGLMYFNVWQTILKEFIAYQLQINSNA